MKVRIDELKLMVNSILGKAKKVGIDELEVENDYYWVVDSEDMFNFTISDPKLNVGSLDDDYENLSKVINGERQPSIVDFDRISMLVKVIGEYISNSSKIY